MIEQGTRLLGPNLSFSVGEKKAGGRGPFVTKGMMKPESLPHPTSDPYIIPTPIVILRSQCSHGADKAASWVFLNVAWGPNAAFLYPHFKENWRQDSTSIAFIFSVFFLSF